MANYILAFHGGTIPENPDDKAMIKEKWGVWMGQVGEAMTNQGAPLGMSSTVSSSGISDDGGANPISGFMVVETDSKESAIGIAKTCPHLEFGGSIEVAEMMKM
ncbi:MAG: hypothetical protein L3J32_02890 [Rhizobiaceae bacterium]|nr:hypothetical protein [Rhizobiaceae bacterium]